MGNWHCAGIGRVEKASSRQQRVLIQANLHLVFGELLVLFKFFLPLGLRAGRFHALDQVPFDDRQTTLGQTGHSSDNNDSKGHGTDRHHPVADNRLNNNLGSCCYYLCSCCSCSRCSGGGRGSRGGCDCGLEACLDHESSGSRGRESRRGRLCP